MEFYFYSSNYKKSTEILSQKNNVPVNNIAPGGDKAVLTLADGSTIVLDSAGNGQLAMQGHTSVTKSGSQIIYGNSERGSYPRWRGIKGVDQARTLCRHPAADNTN